MEARILDLPRSPDTEAFYHPHEEDSVPVSGLHDFVGDYLRDALSIHLPEHWVAEDLCCYWIPGNNRVYLAPDLFVAEPARPHPLPSSFRLWEHGPLRLVIEIGSRTSLRQDVGPKLEQYSEGLRPAEYLYYDADNGVLTLHRLVGEQYVAVPPDAQGKVGSEGARASFALEADGFLRAFDAEGNPLPSHQETAQLRQEAQREAEDARRQIAEAERERTELAQRVAALEAELARLRKTDCS
jgi:Uma2 family endonuclease